MEFFLPFSLREFAFKISYSDKILLAGSCFSEEIGNRLKDLKFTVLQNPNGILYDPLSLASSLFSYIENASFTENDIVELNGVWHSWQHHSSFSGVDKTGVLAKINSSSASAHNFLKEASLLILTFGSSYNYFLKKENKSVSNCHKAPASMFSKRLLSIDEMTDQMSNAIIAIRTFNPLIKILLTISPVKHVKDGLVENNRSKSRLIEMAHSLEENIENVFYFPSYEIVNDVLRDYRFYKSDLVHPNDTAVDFVFEKFCDSLLNPVEKDVTQEVKKLVAAVRHRPFFKESAAHKKFILSQIKRLQRIKVACPFIDLSKEENEFYKQL